MSMGVASEHLPRPSFSPPVAFPRWEGERDDPSLAFVLVSSCFPRPFLVCSCACVLHFTPPFDDEKTRPFLSRGNRLCQDVSLSHASLSFQMALSNSLTSPSSFFWYPLPTDVGTEMTRVPA